jgi:soluble lytic murein transglycosylase-like protein
LARTFLENRVKIDKTYWITLGGILLMWLVVLIPTGGSWRSVRDNSDTLSQLAIAQEAVERQLIKTSHEVARLRHRIEQETAEQVILLKILVLNGRTELSLAREIAYAVHKYAGVYKKDPDLILSIIRHESHFIPGRVSSAGAVGLMQVLPGWQETVCEGLDLENITENIHCGTRVYSYYEIGYKDIMIALTVYNRGPNPVDHNITDGIDPVNQYARDVMATYSKLKEIDGQETPR